MIHVVTPEVYTAYRHELDAMHRLRYRVFGERLRWSVSSVDGRERDQFDDLSPTYLLATEREVLGVWRLLPTTGPYMLRDVFSELLAGQPVPEDAAVWETSRFAVDCGPIATRSLNALSQITRELFCGLVEYCLEQGVGEVLQVYDARIARLLRRVGCSPRWVSEPRWIGETHAVAGRFDIDEGILGNLRQRAGVSGSVIDWSRHRDVPRAA